jgi:di/tricarboxylate transporter
VVLELALVWVLELALATALEVALVLVLPVPPEAGLEEPQAAKRAARATVVAAMTRRLTRAQDRGAAAPGR